MRARVVEMELEKGFGKALLASGETFAFGVSVSVLAVPTVGAETEVDVGPARTGGLKIKRAENRLGCIRPAYVCTVKFRAVLGKRDMKKAALFPSAFFHELTKERQRVFGRLGPLGPRTGSRVDDDGDEIGPRRAPVSEEENATAPVADREERAGIRGRRHQIASPPMSRLRATIPKRMRAWTEGRAALYEDSKSIKRPEECPARFGGIF